MPLTHKGEEILHNMEKEHGKEGGEREFYASKNKGTITGVDFTPGGMNDAPVSPYYGDPPLDPTSIAPPPNSNVEQPSGMQEPVDNSTFNPPPLGDAAMSPVDAFAAFGARAEQADAWARMVGNRDFSGDEHSRMGKLPTEIGFNQMRSFGSGK